MCDTALGVCPGPFNGRIPLRLPITCDAVHILLGVACGALHSRSLSTLLVTGFTVYQTRSRCRVSPCCASTVTQCARGTRQRERHPIVEELVLKSKADIDSFIKDMSMFMIGFVLGYEATHKKRLLQ